MRTDIRNSSVAFLLLVLGITSLGCKESTGVAVHPTSGSLLINGEPATGAIVGLHPLQGDVDERGAIPAGKVKEDGTFVVSTYGVEDGAPAGEFAVTVFWPQFPGRDDPGEDRLRGKYALPTSPVTKVTIGKGENQLEPLDLKAANMLRGE
ncbi:hypothetical protein [Blastopirellula marina]|uniref:Carboxypeptidase regulatory-like domain-containing protein n=1 Tax=Blastopirellula marina TaxID=124 RepID=A0A2S8GQU6_9BACT|nr:hypothetical protein [Blastopirellula marina]PQO46810.1 hypothetical protein C5Y93_06555 [Blastopirellula marina]